MKQNRKLAAAVACAMLIGLCGGHALADGTPDPSQIVTPPELIGQVSPDTALSGSAESSAPDAPSSLFPLSEHRDLVVEGTQSQTSQDIRDKETMEDPEGTVSFENLERRVRENNLTMLALDENLNAIDAMDLEEMREGLTQAVDMLQTQKDQLQGLVDGVSSVLDGISRVLDKLCLNSEIVGVAEFFLLAFPQSTIMTLDTQLATCQDTIDQIDNGVIEAQTDDAAAQIANAQNQIVMGAQTLYITLLGLEQTQQNLERSLAALDRTSAELDIRYEMGQISALTLAEVKSGRTSLLSGMKTLEMNLTGLRRQLEAMLGLEETPGTIQLAPLTAVTAEDLAELDYDRDLEWVMKRSYTLEAAEKAWHDAADSYYELRDSDTAADYEVEAARYSMRAADLSHQAAEQSLGLSFAALWDQIADQQQVLSAAKTALAVQQDTYAAAQLKYEQGVLSHNKLLDAADTLESARDTVETEQIDLFTSLNTYRWAVKHGILN